MPVARTTDEAFEHRKRWLLESRLQRTGIVWGDARRRGPMSGLECVQRVWAHLDGLRRKDGNLEGIDAGDLEAIAGWPGEPGVLWRELIATGWIDDLGSGRFAWHDFADLNERAITARENGSKGGRPRRPPGGQHETQIGTQDVTQHGTQSGTQPISQLITQPITQRVTQPEMNGATPGGLHAPSGPPGESRDSGAMSLLLDACGDLLPETPKPRAEPNPYPNPEPNAKQSGSGSSEKKKTIRKKKDVPSEGNVLSGPGGPDETRPRGLQPGPDAFRLAEDLAGSILRHTPTFRRPPKLDAWAREIDLALRLDGRTVEDVTRAIRFAHVDPAGSFWRPNVLSGSTLRKQLDRLLMQADRAERDPRAAGLGARDLERIEAGLRERGS